MRKHLLTPFVTLALTLIAAGPASAADEIGLSNDGVAFTSTLTTPLFDPDMVWVPGDSESGTFFVRNQGGSDAKMRVTLIGNHVGDLLDSGDVRVAATSEGGSSTTVSDGASRLILTVEDIDESEVVPVTVTVDFDSSSSNDTQLRSTDLRLRVNLTEDAAVSDGGASTDTGPDALLPDTGAPPFTWLLAVAALLIGGGVSLLRFRTTSRQDAHHG